LAAVPKAEVLEQALTTIGLSPVIGLVRAGGLRPIAVKRRVADLYPLAYFYYAFYNRVNNYSGELLTWLEYLQNYPER
jgi:hypothetical protein